jgi:hypothetical protein
MAERLRLRDIQTPNEPALRAAYALLKRTFPPRELVPLDEMKNSLRERSEGVLADLRWHMVVAQRGKSVIGAASGTYFGSINSGIIGYLAVNSRTRTRGLGVRLRNRLRVCFELDALRLRKRRLAALVGEVEADNPWLAHLVRRGALVLDFPYVQPSVRPNEPAVALALYYEPLDGKRSSVPASLVRQLVFAIWRRGYRIARPLDDRRFRTMLRSLKDRTLVRARKVRPAQLAASPRE